MRLVVAHLGSAIRYPSSYGDLWATTWADDVNLHSASDDTSGFGEPCTSNMAINRLTGDTPPDRQSAAINPMSEFGRVSPFSDDNGMWKASSLTCIDGVLYQSVSRRGDNEHEPIFVQETWDASIVKSEDQGRTWAPTLLATGQPFATPMFPGQSFSAPLFVQYRRDGHGTAGADTGVSAVSSDGVWRDGSSMTLGRARRDRIRRLDATSWEFVNGFDAARQPMWGPRHNTGLYTSRAPVRTSITGIHYIAPLGLNIMRQWHFSHLDNPNHVRRWMAIPWIFYQALTQWRPGCCSTAKTSIPKASIAPAFPVSSSATRPEHVNLHHGRVGDRLQLRHADDAGVGGSTGAEGSQGNERFPAV